jgi:hypothetical protein
MWYFIVGWFGAGLFGTLLYLVVDYLLCYEYYYVIRVNDLPKLCLMVGCGPFMLIVTFIALLSECSDWVEENHKFILRIRRRKIDAEVKTCDN